MYIKSIPMSSLREHVCVIFRNNHCHQLPKLLSDYVLFHIWVQNSYFCYQYIGVVHPYTCSKCRQFQQHLPSWSEQHLNIGKCCLVKRLTFSTFYNLLIVAQMLNPIRLYLTFSAIQIPARSRSTTIWM